MRTRHIEIEALTIRIERGRIASGGVKCHLPMEALT